MKAKECFKEGKISSSHFDFQKEVLSFKEALVVLDISASTLYKMTSKRAITFSKPNNGKIYFRRADLVGWLLSNSNQSIREINSELEEKLKEKGL